MHFPNLPSSIISLPLLFLLLFLLQIPVTSSYPNNVSLSISCHELSVEAQWNVKDFDGGNITKVVWNDPACRWVKYTIF